MHDPTSEITSLDGIRIVPGEDPVRAWGGDVYEVTVLGPYPACANCGLEIEPDGDGWGHVDAAEPFDSDEYKRFLDRGCADPRPVHHG